VSIHAQHSISFCPAVSGRPAGSAASWGCYILQGRLKPYALRVSRFLRRAFHSGQDCKTLPDFFRADTLNLLAGFG